MTQKLKIQKVTPLDFELLGPADRYWGDSSRKIDFCFGKIWIILTNVQIFQFYPKKCRQGGSYTFESGLALLIYYSTYLSSLSGPESIMSCMMLSGLP